MPSMKSKPADEKPSFRDRLSTMRTGFVATRRSDPRFLPLVVGVPVVVLVVVEGAFVALGQPWIGLLPAVLLALLTALVIFGRRASAAQVHSIEGQPGAAAAVLNTMRGAWITTPAVAFTRKQDFVHRVVGPPGIVLVGEGAPARVGQLLKQERRKISKFAGQAAIHEVSVGSRDDQVPLPRLQGHLMKLPRSIKPKQVGPLNTRLSAVRQPEMPIPKGPLPYSKKKR
jgi:hypothetical protein